MEDKFNKRSTCSQRRRQLHLDTCQPDSENLRSRTEQYRTNLYQLRHYPAQSHGSHADRCQRKSRRVRPPEIGLSCQHESRNTYTAECYYRLFQLLPHIEDAEERNHYISLINHNNELLLNIIKRCTGFIEDRSRTHRVGPGLVQPLRLIDESCTECQPNVPEGVTLKKRYPATPNLIKQDPMRIKQVLSNLISNALKNTVQGYVRNFRTRRHRPKQE